MVALIAPYRNLIENLIDPFKETYKGTLTCRSTVHWPNPRPKNSWASEYRHVGLRVGG